MSSGLANQPPSRSSTATSKWRGGVRHRAGGLGRGILAWLRIAPTGRAERTPPRRLAGPLAVPPRLPPPGWRRPTAGLVWAALAGLLGAAGLLYAFNPTEYGFYPVCFFHQATGLECPGCGTLRATHQLLHGHFGAAFALNPLLFVVGPVVGWGVVAGGAEVLLGLKLPQPFHHPAWVWVFTGALLLFGVGRNLALVQAVGLAH